MHVQGIRDEADEATAYDLKQEAYAAFDRADYKAAANLLDQYLLLVPRDADMIYNLACAHAQLDNIEQAAATLLRAVKAGFKDFNHLRRDPDLAPVRGHETFKAILEAADRVKRRPSEGSFEYWKRTYGEENYRYERDSERRLDFATALDATSHSEMVNMLAKQADYQAQALFGGMPSYNVLVAVPTPDDADRFFKGDDRIGGMYIHGDRRLVARDIGGSLRHEFTHLMHFGHMERLNQIHPLWIQEGIACLFEDYELIPPTSALEGTLPRLRILPNTRQLIAQNRAKAGKLTPWDDLFVISSDAFMGKAQHMYPQVRLIFEYVAEQGLFNEWYRTYTQTFMEDRSGRKAFEQVFGKPLDQIERDWRKWLINRPAVDLWVDVGEPALGIRTGDNLSNDGILVTDVLPRSAASKAGLKRGDVIVGIDERPTRSMEDVGRILSAREVGDAVNVRFRRDAQYMVVEVVLRPLAAGH